MRPPLIAHVIFRLDVGGLENGLINLVNRMPRDFRHAIVCLAGFSDFRQRIERADVEVYSLNKQPGKDLGAYARCWRLLRALRPSIVHTRNLGTVDMQCVAFAARVPARVHSEHGFEASDPRGVNVKSLRIRRTCRPFIQRYAAVSQDLARWLTERVGVAADDIAQIYNGVDTTKFSPQGALPQDVPWSRAQRPLVFGTVGRLDPIKNQQALLHAFANLVRAYPDRALRLGIVGDGPLAVTLRTQANELGIADRVWFAGARNDVAEQLRAFDVFVLPSLNEGISNTLLEAMACGKPVIAGAVGGNVELVQDGRTGTLCTPDAQSLLQAMRGYVETPARVAAHGDAARARACEKFSLDAMVSAYSDFYRQMLGQTLADRVIQERRA